MREKKSPAEDIYYEVLQLEQNGDIIAEDYLNENLNRLRNDEVDFVSKIPNKVIALEVKSSKVRSAMRHECFSKKYSPDKL
jgi:hypothetical protein